MLFTTYPPADADQQIRRIQELLERGKKDAQIKETLQLEEFEELLSIAKARLRSKKTSDDYFMLEEDLRFATNELVAEHRANRLACDILVEVGCGIGIQTIAFAKTCKKVIAIDIDPRKVEYAKANAAKRKLTNIEFIADDGLNVLKQLKHASIVFCDPGRPAAEDVRDIETSFSPHLPTLIKEAERLTKDIAIELPPQIQISKAKWELEYLSVAHQINRLTAYLGKLMQARLSACILPGAHTLQGTESAPFPTSRPLKYLYEVDPAVIKTNLTGFIPAKELFSCEEYLTSLELIESPFFKSSYRVVTTTKKPGDVKAILKRERVGRVILHGSISQEKYWEERKKFEAGLEGKRVFHLFVGKELIVCKSLSERF